MTRNREFPFLDIIEVNRDSVGSYIKIHAIFEDGEIDIRWGIDEFTYSQLKKAISQRYFDTMPGLHYEFKLLLSTTISNRRESEDKIKYESCVECSFGKQRKNIQFQCSKLFASNISWFCNIKSFRELSDLEWKDV